MKVVHLSEPELKKLLDIAIESGKIQECKDLISLYCGAFGYLFDTARNRFVKPI